MSNYKLSIIIPVYNVEPYLEECVESILHQEQKNCQIILVDDGSTDSSGDICDRYKAFPDFTVIHKENGGLSSARNAGIGLAEGEFVAFLDSDDRLSDGALLAVMDWTNTGGADICFMEAINFYPDGRTSPMGDSIDPEKVRGKSRKEVFSHLSTRPKYPGSACTKLFRRSFLEKNSIRFPCDRRLSEDLIFCLNCFLAAESFAALSFPYYEYRKNRVGSITDSVSMKSFSGMTAFLEEAVSLCMLNGHPKDQISECAMSFAAYEYSIMLWQFSRLSSSDKDKANEFLKQYRWVLRYGQSRKIKLVRAASDLLGLEAAAKLLDLYMKNR